MEQRQQMKQMSCGGIDEDFMKYLFPEFELIYDDTVKEVTMDEVEAKFGCKVKIKND